MKHLILYFLSLSTLSIPAFGSSESYAERESIQASTVDADFGELIYKVRLNVPYGHSTWRASFAPAGASPIKVVYIDEPSCKYGPYLRVSVKVASTKVWQHTNYENGLDYYQGGAIDGIQLDLDQPSWGGASCEIRVYSKKGQSANPTTSNESLIGAIAITGGFQQAVGLAVKSTKVVTHFRLDIPAFCKDLQVLEAFSITEGVQDKAKLVDATKNLFEINDGAGSRISQILVSINGPVGTQCQVPVFIVEK